jgi:flagellar protein FliO/FliZ
MSQSLWPVLLFIVLLALVPLGVKWMRRQKLGGLASAVESKIVSAVAVGPQQRVVSVEVGPRDARVMLTLGVTAQSINVLHSAPLDSAPPSRVTADVSTTQTPV